MYLDRDVKVMAAAFSEAAVGTCQKQLRLPYAFAQ